MRINNNIAAQNSHRQYSINNANVSKAVEKLSSGFRINRAGDDAAGLAISEKMRSQIRGLSMASKNSQDAISLVQTAEGALQESHNILQRMRELAVQSSSDTNETSIDRGALQQEFSQLVEELDDIASKTKFNDMSLIDGSFSSSLKTATANAAGSTSWAASTTKDGTYNIVATAVTTTPAVAAVDNTYTDALTIGGTGGTLAITHTAPTTNPQSGALNGSWAFSASGSTYTLTNSATGESRSVTGLDLSTNDLASETDFTLDFGDLGTVLIENTSTTADATGVTIGGTMTVAAGVTAKAAEIKHVATLNGEEVELKENMSTLYFKNSGVSVMMETAISKTQAEGTAAININGGATATIQVSVSSTSKSALVIQSGANEGDELSISIGKMDSKTLGVASASIASRADASVAITQVNSAVNQVSTQRAALGALQNRLDHKIANLDTSSENLTAAESRIRDVDMAKEMTNFTKQNILSQAATAMLAQANSLPQNVLSLLG